MGLFHDCEYFVKGHLQLYNQASTPGTGATNIQLVQTIKPSAGTLGFGLKLSNASPCLQRCNVRLRSGGVGGGLGVGSPLSSAVWYLRTRPVTRHVYR